MIQQGSERKLVFLLPNLMTAGNLFCGFMAVLQIFQGSILRSQETEGWITYYQHSLFFILAAVFFDILDGRLARFARSESAFGREFDSLADLISFGIAPALLVFKIVLFELPNRTGWMIAFIYLVCGAFRLARFNVMATAPATEDSKKNFTGFPIPAAAGVIISITLVLLKVYESDNEIGNWKYLLAALMLFLSFMMFSKFKYPSMKAINWRSRRSIPVFLGIVIFGAFTFQYYEYALAIVFVGYLLYGFLRPYLSAKWRSELEDTHPPQA
jgi:CDP-diacylglycerol--serine O-phosphatidyltransferase